MKLNLPVLVSGLALADASALISVCDKREGPLGVDVALVTRKGVTSVNNKMEVKN